MKFHVVPLILTLTVIQFTAVQSHQERRDSEQVFPHNSDYEIISIQWPRLQKRDKSGDGIQVRAFGSDIKLWLEPTDGVLVNEDTPVYKAKVSSGKIRFVEDRTIIGKYAKSLYEDRAKRASVVVRDVGGRKEIVGHIGSENLTILPVPDHLRDEIQLRQLLPDSQSHNFHVAIKTPNSALEYSSGKRSKRDIPDVLYPEILVVVAYDLYKRLALAEDIAVPYLLAFWNAVDLKYRSLENPKFRLNIAGIVLPESERVLSYVPSGLHDARLLEITKTIVGSGFYWAQMSNRIANSDRHDVIVTMSSYQFCDKNATSGGCDLGPLGYAFNGGACNTKGTADLARNVAVIHDSAGFDGIYTAAHELGHLLGAHHDGTYNTQCKVEDGFIMAPAPILNSNSSSWSGCSLLDIEAKLNGGEAKCLYNHPLAGRAMPRYLPGQMMNADHQCLKIEGTRACRIDASICQVLKCVDGTNATLCERMNGPAAEGTPCGDNKMCLNAQCIDESLLG